MKKSLCTGRAHLLAKSHRWLLDSHGLRQSSLRKCAVSVFYSAKYSTLVANVRNDTDNETADWIKDLELKQQRAFLDNLATKLGVKEFADWYRVHPRDVKQHKGTSLLNRHTSLSKMLKAVYPEFPWKSSEFMDKRKTRQKSFLDRARQQLGIQEMSDWYRVKRQDLRKMKGVRGFFHHYSSLPQALQTIYPGYTWEPHRFTQVEGGYWANLANQREFLERVGKKLGVVQLADWYKVSRKKVTKQNEGGEGLWHYHRSLPEALKAVYPEYPWEMHRFAESGHFHGGYWSNIANQREYLGHIREKLGIQQISDWYKVRRSELDRYQGWRLLHHYPSLMAALKAIYPEYPWIEENFVHKRGYWQDSQNLLEILNQAEEKIGIQKPEDWYSVTMADLKHIGFPAAIKTRSQLTQLLTEKYPGHQWEKLPLLRRKFAQQGKTKKAVIARSPKAAGAEALIVQSIRPNEWECELPNGVRFIGRSCKEFEHLKMKAGDIVSFKHSGYLLSSKKPKFPLLHRLRDDMTWQGVLENWREAHSPPSRPKKLIEDDDDFSEDEVDDDGMPSLGEKT